MSHPAIYRRIMVLTGEPSGDVHAGQLVSEIKKLDPDIHFTGIGGPHLEHEKVDLFYPISKLSAMGITEVVVQFRQIMQAFDRFKKKLRQQRYDLLILVDYPGFNLKAAEYAKRNHNIPVLYFITPKVWAWKKSRLNRIKSFVDHAALILPFEEKIYKKAGIPATYVGNPLMDEYPDHLTRAFQKQTKANHSSQITIGLLPGSRRSEVNRLLPVMLKSADLIRQKQKGVRFVISNAGSVKKQDLEQILATGETDAGFEVFQGPVRDIFSVSDLIIAASGTVTLEAALYGIPTILIYKMSYISFSIAKIFVELQYAGLANLIVDKEVMPELLQGDATPGRISRKVIRMLGELEFYQDQLTLVRRFLGNNGASKRAAAIALQLMRRTAPLQAI